MAHSGRGNGDFWGSRSPYDMGHIPIWYGDGDRWWVTFGKNPRGLGFLGIGIDFRQIPGMGIPTFSGLIPGDEDFWGSGSISQGWGNPHPAATQNRWYFYNYYDIYNFLCSTLSGRPEKGREKTGGENPGGLGRAERIDPTCHLSLTRTRARTQPHYRLRNYATTFKDSFKMSFYPSVPTTPNRCISVS